MKSHPFDGRRRRPVRLLLMAAAFVAVGWHMATTLTTAQNSSQNGSRNFIQNFAPGRLVPVNTSPVHVFALAVDEGTPLRSLSALALLGLGLVFGLKHATEVDHIVAVTTIVSEHRKLSRAALVGAVWGLGHTAALIVVGAVVLVSRVAIPPRAASWLEFGVALMIVGLGISACVRALRQRADAHAVMHLHQHAHGAAPPHTHLHFHEQETAHTVPFVAAAAPHSHIVARAGIKPFIVGAVHGLAGSAVLTVLVLTQIESTALGLLYLAVFGLGSIAGMLLMSGLVGLPFVLTARRLSGTHHSLQALAGSLSIAFGLWYAYEKGIASGLLGM